MGTKRLRRGRWRRRRLHSPRSPGPGEAATEGARDEDEGGALRGGRRRGRREGSEGRDAEGSTRGGRRGEGDRGRGGSYERCEERCEASSSQGCEVSGRQDALRLTEGEGDGGG